MNKRLLIVIGLIISIVFSSVQAFDILKIQDKSLSDYVYQHTVGSDGEIVVIGIDDRALDELGLFPWPRNYIAEAIEYMNSDPDNRPAIIGLDILFDSEGNDEEANNYLIDVCGEYGNVIVASSAHFDTSIVDDNDTIYIDDRTITNWAEPFEGLYNVTDTGHINAMLDEDGIFRSGLLYIDTQERGRVYSLPKVIYNRWCELNNIEKYEPNIDKEGFFYVRFTNQPGGYYDNVSVVDLLRGEIDSDYFAGKIVLIGPYAQGLQDSFLVSANHGEPMYGVEVQANIIDALRSEFTPIKISSKIQAIFTFIASLFTFIWFYDKKVRYIIPIWAILSFGWIGISYISFNFGYMLNTLYLPLSVSLIFIESLIINYVDAQREKKHVTNTFGRYVDPVVMHKLLEKGSNNIELGGKNYNIAVLFVDIRGFTTMSEALPPETVVEIINKYLTLTTECIMKNHGTLDKFVGDCTMAFWNAPLPQEDAVYLACKAAMDMVEGSKTLGQELQERFGRTVQFGIGINWGPAVVGNIGALKRMDYTAIGDTVNTAARLEANAPGGTIYISRSVADILGDKAVTTSLGGSIKLKGKAEGFEVLTLDKLN